MGKYNKILVIQTAFIGDAILASALLEKIHFSYPDSELHFLVRKGNEGLFANHPFLHKVWVFDKKESKYKKLFSLALSFRKEKFDLLINLQRFATTGLLSVLSGAKTLIGFNKNPFSFLFTKSYPHDISSNSNSKTHEINRNQLLVSDFCDDELFKPKLYPRESDYEKIMDFTETEYITVAPSSVWFTKQFPKHKWVEFLDSLDSKLKVYLLGGGGDRNSCEEIISLSKHKNIQNLSGALGFLESAALMKSAKMNYVNDSAPMHLCSSVNAPVCAVYCSTVPAFGFGPLSDRSYVIEVKEKLECRPCGLHGRKSCPKGHFKCAENIDIQQLLEVIHEQ